MTTLTWLEPAARSTEVPQLHFDPLIDSLLCSRGITSTNMAAEFLNDRPRYAPDCSLMPNIGEATERLLYAIDHGERVGIFGDYDVDGVTSTALLATALGNAGDGRLTAIPRLPTRDEGYGLNRRAIDELVEAGVTLLIAVDCGSGDHEHVAYARDAGLDVIAIDHHQIHGKPADGAIVVSPQLAGGEGFQDLSAVGLAYLVASNLARHGVSIGGPNGPPETALLDLVALGTLADVVSLAGVNRSLVRDGIGWLRKGRRPGVSALVRRSGLTEHLLTSDQIVFKMTPRLNAAGRMGDPQLALDVLLASTPEEAYRLVAQLEQVNDQRRAESGRVLQEAEQKIREHPETLANRVLVLADPQWPGGLLGPAASKLGERYGRPVVLLHEDGATSHGSARSVAGFDVASALDACRHLLIRSGGHGQAAGLTIRTEAIPGLVDALGEVMAASGIEVSGGAIQIDADVEVSRLTLDTVHLLDQLQPFGAGNEQPTLRFRNLPVRQYDVIGQDRSHLRMQFETPRGPLKAIFFGAAGRSSELIRERTVDAVGRLKIDTWNDRPRLDMEIRDFRPASGSVR